jgi:RimJ/RimL family protein N-acetyltransferase
VKRIILDEADRVGEFVLSFSGGGYTPGRGSAIGLEENGTLIAGVLFDSYNGASVCMHVAALPGARWMTKQYLGVCFAYPFRQLHVNKILGLVGSANFPARRFDEHLGFQLEATLPAAHPDGDLLIYTMTESQCRWLNIKLEPLV